MSSNAYFNPMMLRLLVVRSRTARSSIYSEKAEIKSPRELLGGPSPEARPARYPAPDGTRIAGRRRGDAV
ncbi:MAG TPA: hypothetical protein VLG74_10460, partial [Blastocatellia bacterium]|nr:hypothetical protein [Blastocatellia bacterium]